MQLTSIQTQLPQHQLIARDAFDSFVKAEQIVAANANPAADAPPLSDAIAQVRSGLELLTTAYDRIPDGEYNPGNLAITTAWAGEAMTAISTANLRAAADLLDSVIERVQNDFDL